jgi:hypothetical protein
LTNLNWNLSSHYLVSNEWTEFTIINDDKTLFSVDKATGKTTIQSLTVTNEIQLPAEIEAKLALVDTLQAKIAALEVIHNYNFIDFWKIMIVAAPIF